ncbi:putative ATP-binding cassette sub-family A member 2 [Apostichopus japonicus]|uniref:Putative ATP-binding cassette sub-family A member 2 n=1 Tax=Stichopus japonicus TaxID=307972 RepID=A0A2G8KQ42_STIJA|nr:putative ATP-binding cassette sub-family A member 2 [Apostichopus japonicus]
MSQLSLNSSRGSELYVYPAQFLKVYKILYGSEPRNVSEDDGSAHNYTDYQEFINRRFGGLNHGALYRHESKSSIYSVTGVLGILSGTPVGGPKSGSSEGEDSLSEGLVNSFEDSLFSPETLQDVLCNEETVHDLYNSDNQTDFNTSRSFADATCNREDSYDIFESLSNELHDQIDTGKVLDLLNITDEELSRMKNMTAALMDEDALQSLVAFAEILPADSCPEEPLRPPHRASLDLTTLSMRRHPGSHRECHLPAVNSTNVTESSNCSSPCNQSSSWRNLIAHPEFMQNVSMKPEVRNFILNDSLISPPLIEQNLDVLDNVACAWLSLVGPIKWDILSASRTRTTWSICPDKAASRNITVFASLVFDVDQDGNLPATWFTRSAEFKLHGQDGPDPSSFLRWLGSHASITESSATTPTDLFGCRTSSREPSSIKDGQTSH